MLNETNQVSKWHKSLEKPFKESITYKYHGRQTLHSYFESQSYLSEATLL